MGCIFWCRQLRFDITHEKTHKELKISWRQIPYGRNTCRVGQTADIVTEPLLYNKTVSPLLLWSSTGTVRRLFHPKSYDSTAPVRRPAGGRKNHTIFLSIVYAMVTNHLRAPYCVYFTTNRTILRRQAGGRKNRTIF